jgi:hypothetical protein
LTLQPDIEPAARCPQCGRSAAPEQDGECSYYECSACGAVFGYRLNRPEGPACAAGLPLPAEEPVFLGPTILRRAQ